MTGSRAHLYLVRFSQPTLGCSEMAVPRSPTQPNRSERAYRYPLKWIEGTFNSKEKTESLLRPEVENGNVPYHDMELAQASDIYILAQTGEGVTPVVFYSPSSQARNAIYQ